MKTVTFVGTRGQEALLRMKSHAELLRSCDSVKSLTGEARRQAELELLSFIVHAYRNPTPTGQQRYGGHLRRHQECSLINRHIFRVLLSRVKQRVEWCATPEDRPQAMAGLSPLSVGYAEGVTMVFPLREAAFQEFVGTDMNATALNAAHIVPEQECPPRSQEFLYIGGVIHLSAVGVDEPRPSDSFPLIKQLIHHVGYFLPTIRRSLEDTFQAEQPYRMPKIACVIDQEVEKRVLAERVGFRRTGTNDMGSPKYLLDLEDLNDSHVPRERFFRMLRWISLLQHYCNEPRQARKRPVRG